MGFSIGNLLRSVAPIVGGIFGGPVGAVLGTAVAASFNPGAAGRRPQLPGPTVRAAALPALIPAAGVMMGRALAVGGVIAGILALSRERTGRPASAKKIRESARVCGLEVTAETFGISVQDVCTIIISRRSRRGRGISAADLRRTRSTIRKITTMQHSLAHFVSHQKRGAGGKFI